MVRQMGSFDVQQRTKDGMFNATDLLKQWNYDSGQKKELKSFFKLKNTHEFIDELIKEENLNGYDSTHLKVRGKYGGTWMTPILFVKFAMWINPRFEVQVIKFVYDQLIEFRNDAGDNYKELSSSVQKFIDINYPIMAKGLNHIVFGKHKKGIRQEATTAQLTSLNDLQKKLAFAIDMGYIKSFDELLSEMRRLYFLRKN